MIGNLGGNRYRDGKSENDGKGVVCLSTRVFKKLSFYTGWVARSSRLAHNQERAVRFRYPEYYRKVRTECPKYTCQYGGLRYRKRPCGCDCSVWELDRKLFDNPPIERVV